MTQVFYPGDAPEVWNGQFGGAIVRNGPLKAITSDGKEHGL